MARITIAEDVTRGPGWVRISVKAPPQAAPHVVISQRQSDTPFLGPNGWQSQRHALAPRSVEEEEGGFALLFGPEVTEHLALDERVDVALEGAGIQERHHWPDVAPAPKGVSGGIGLAPPAPAGPPPPAPRAPPQDAPRGLPPPELALPPPSLPLRSWRWSLYVAFGVLLLILGAAFVWRLAADQGRGGMVATDVPPTVPAETMAARFARYRAQAGYASELYVLSVEARAAGDLDLAAQALGLGAQRNSPEANLEMGRRYDPGSAQSGTDRVEPQPASALRYYCRARQLGDARAEPLLDALRRRAASPPRDEVELFGDFPDPPECPSS